MEKVAINMPMETDMKGSGAMIKRMGRVVILTLPLEKNMMDPGLRAKSMDKGHSSMLPAIGILGSGRMETNMARASWSIPMGASLMESSKAIRPLATAS